jgi:hypothetical protein
MRDMAASRSLPTRHAVDFRDHVTAVNPGGRGRRVTERANHAQRPIGGRYFDADACVRSGGADTQVGVFLGIEITGIGIEAAHQATQCVIDELGVVDFVDVLRAARAPGLRPTARIRRQ